MSIRFNRSASSLIIQYDNQRLHPDALLRELSDITKQASATLIPGPIYNYRRTAKEVPAFPADAANTLVRAFTAALIEHAAKAVVTALL